MFETLALRIGRTIYIFVNVQVASYIFTVFQWIVMSVNIINYICISFISETIFKIYQLDQMINYNMYKIIHSDSWCFNYIFVKEI